jgi:hypothetical protein
MPKLGAIDNPDGDTSLCRYRPDAVDLRDGLCHLGLPNMIDSDTSLATVSRQVTICPGDTITLSATGGDRYAWSPVEGLQCPGCATTRAVPRSTTAYVVAISEGNCTRYDTVHVTVRQPRIGAGRDISICRGDSVSLSATGGISYRWHPASEFDCDSCATMIAHPVATTTYVVVGTTADGCRDSARVTVSVGDTLIVDAGVDTTTCAGEEVRLAGRGGRSFRWSPAEGLSCDSCADPLARPLHTTRYTLVSFNGPDCSSTDTVRVTVDSVAADAGPDQPLCYGDTLQLAASVTGSYSWEPSPEMSCTDCLNPRVWPRATTSYRLRVTGDRGCVAFDSVTVTVLPLPVADAGPGRTICRGEPVRLAATGGTSYHWSPATGLNCTDCDAPMAAPDTTTLYTLDVVDANGCHAADTVRVVVLDAPHAEAGDDATICVGGSTRLHAGGGDRYKWSPPEGLNCTDCEGPLASPAVTTTYSVVATGGNGCTNIDSVRVTVVGPEEASLEVPRDLRAMPGSSILVPIHLGSAVPIAADTVAISIAYNAGMLRSEGVDLADGPLGNWRQEVVKDTAGMLSLRFVSPGGLISGPGRLLGFRFRAFLGDSLGCELPVMLGFGEGTCFLPSAVTGRVALDSICGLSFRLIERSGSEYSLKQNSPNPFNPTTTIEFTLGLEGPTTLEVLDAGGGRVGLLIDELLGPGRYSVVWEGGERPSGLYYCRLRSGTWNRTMQMLLVK